MAIKFQGRAELGEIAEPMTSTLLQTFHHNGAQTFGDRHKTRRRGSLLINMLISPFNKTCGPKRHTACDHLVQYYPKRINVRCDRRFVRGNVLFWCHVRQGAENCSM